MKKFYVIKANGERQVFDRQKIETSLKRSGATEDSANKIILEIEKTAHDGITTKEIYKKAYALLRKVVKPAAIRYSLKQAVATLGPTGFPFEKYIAELFKAQGYNAVTGEIVLGNCVEHEIDIVAWKGDELVMAEAKFHTDYNIKSDLKVALYVKARYDDIFGRTYYYGGKDMRLSLGCIITNTKFSSTAIRYASCQPSLKFIGWNYPAKGNLHDELERYELIPVTALTSINSAEKGIIMSKGIILSKSLLKTSILEELGFDSKKIKAIQDEVNALCKYCKDKYSQK